MAPEVAEQEIGRGVVGDEEVQAAVLVEVGGDDPEAAAVAVDDPRARGDIHEPPPVVAEEAVGQGLGQERVAVEIGLGLRVAADPRVVEVPGRIVADVEVEVAVAVQVGQGRRGRPVAPAPQSPRVGDVLEGPVAAVAVEGIRSPAGDEDVGAAVAVDVADGDAVAMPAGEPADPRAVGDVLEGAVSPVVEQAIPAAAR